MKSTLLRTVAENFVIIFQLEIPEHLNAFLELKVKKIWQFHEILNFNVASTINTAINSELF